MFVLTIPAHHVGGGPSPIGAVRGVAWFGVESAKVAASKGSKATDFVTELDAKIKLVSNLLMAASPIDTIIGVGIALRGAKSIKEGTETSKYKPKATEIAA